MGKPEWLIIIVSLMVISGFLIKPVRTNTYWHAMVTPLASIIGSGFLVAAPLLRNIAGSQVIPAMIIITVFAYAIGSVIRFNILHSEPLEKSCEGPAGLSMASRTSNLVLTLAYGISVAFYIRLLSAFVLSKTPVSGLGLENWLATGILISIGIIGWFYNLKGLEFVETISVSIKLSIIAAVLAALVVFNYSHHTWAIDLTPARIDWVTRARMLAGMLLIVQGFETSRYLGDAYPAQLRVRSMRSAQITSTLIYLAFIALIVPILIFLPAGKPDETAIIGLSGHISWVLPYMLIVAAFMSQLSAAVADTVGAGGLVSEETSSRISERQIYPVVVIFSIALIWLFNIFEVITIASRAFALYYFLQTVIALLVANYKTHRPGRIYDLVRFSLIASMLALIVVFALPVE